MANGAHRRQRAGLGRSLRLLAGAVLAFELVYLVLANGFLHSDWGRQTLNRRPQSLAIAWQRAWTWLPGIVHVRGLEVRGRGRRADWSATVDRGRMAILLPALLRRHFRLLGGRADGAEVDIQVRPANAAPLPPPRRRAWRVSLEGLAVESLRRLRLNDHEVRGRGRAAGWVRFQVRGPMEMELTSISLAGARLLDGEATAAEALRLDGRLRVDPFVIGEDTVQDLLAGLTATIEVETEASSLGFLAAYLEAAPWLRLGGSGHLVASLEANRGWLAPGSRVTLQGPTLETELFGLHATGEGRLTGRVPDGAAHTELAVELPSFAVRRQTDSALMLEGEDLRLVVTNDSNAIDRPAQGLTVSVDLPPTRIPDLAVYSVYLPEATGLAITGGNAELAARLTYSTLEHNGDGWLRLTGSQVEAAFGEVRIWADLALDARLAEARLEEGQVDISGSRLEIDRVRTRQGDRQRDSGWWGRIELPRGRLRLPRGDPAAASAILEGELAADLRDTGPLVALLEQHVPRLAWMDGLLTVHDVEARSEVRVASPRLALADLRVTGGRKGRLEILGQLDLARQDPAGLVFARWGGLSAAVSLDEGERDWKLIGSRRWYDEAARAYRSRRTAAAVEP